MTTASLLGATLGRRTLLAAGATGGIAMLGLAEPPTLYVLGDSWAAGFHADPSRALGQVAAAALGWRADVDAVSGTGYLTATPAGAAYPIRAASGMTVVADRVAVLQGGSNDDGADHAAIPAALAATVAAVRVRLPRARVLVLGPGPDPAPVTGAQADVDLVLQAETERLHVAYVSMMQEGWFPPGNAVIDPATAHPTVAGQRYLGLKLASAIRQRFPGVASGRLGGSRTRRLG